MKVAISTPLYGEMPHQYAASLLRTLSALDAAGIEHSVLLQPGDTYVHHARDALMHMFLASDCDRVFMIDSDIAWRPEDFIKLLLAPYDVCAGLYRMRNRYEQFTGIPDTDKPDAFGGLKASKLPTGFMCVSRHVAQAVSDAETVEYLGSDGETLVKHVFFAGPRDGLWWTEDYTYCEKVKACGFDMYIVPDVTLAHIHPAAYVGNYHEASNGLPGNA